MSNNTDPRIEVLPRHVVEKIAAGEVVERPASVLKELIENSIDARASAIDIVIEDSGFGLIHVTDNGTGMSRENLEKSVLRHATSKIRNADDLFAIATMGFRGEALASIGAVSKTAISSSNTNEGLGYTLTCEGGVAGSVVPVAHMRGTTVACRDLFYNVPARKKFIKTRKAERIALVKLLEQIAVPFPGVRFTATFEGKLLFETPVAADVLARISQVAGVEFAGSLVKAQGAAKGMEAVLYFPLQGGELVRPRYQNLYVNLRRVDNDSVLYGVRQAFSQLIRRDARPSFFCFIDVDPAAIDVNVHPTKQKVKFENERELFGFIYGTVARVLKPAADKGPGRPVTEPQGLKQIQAAAAPEAAPYPVTGEVPSLDPFRFSTEEKGDASYGQTILSFPGERQAGAIPAGQGTVESVLPENEAGSQLWNLISCYQIHEMFILAPIKNGILLIDQHAAHERILYEQALEDIKERRAASQQLLFPVVLHLTATEKAVADASGEYFRTFGFDIQDFGGSDVSISAAPAFLPSNNVERSVRDMIGYLLDEKSVEHFPEPHRRYAAAFACGAAIKSGQKLSGEEMNALLNSLFSSKNPYTCPHGRPTVVRISVDELSRRFLR
jgi:DNA mismatch repair protein MutL